jgi:hypothetical protein
MYVVLEKGMVVSFMRCRPDDAAKTLVQSGETMVDLGNQDVMSVSSSAQGAEESHMSKRSHWHSQAARRQEGQSLAIANGDFEVGPLVEANSPSSHSKRVLA